MDDASDTPLTFCTTQELIAELSSRYTAFVIVAAPKFRKDGLQMHSVGDTHVCRGLVGELAAFTEVQRQIEWEDALLQEDDDG